MNEWEIFLTSETESDLEKLDTTVRKRILEKLKWFKKNFRQITPLPLTGEWKGFFKLVIGDWRVIYKINNTERLIMIYRIEHRSKVYRI